jgi:hypothetical protein
MRRTLLPPILVALISLTSCGADDPEDIQGGRLDCVFQVTAPDGESQTDRASIGFLAGGSAAFSLPAYEANVYIEEWSGQAPSMIRFEVVGPDDFRVETRGEADPSVVTGTRQGGGSAQPGSGDDVSWECIAP